MTVKDPYSLPQIQETLECLWGAVWFTSPDLILSYWQVRMRAECKAYMAFTVRPLGFYKSECVPFGLTNAPATFQFLLETCLGDLQWNWWIIYLDDIIVFATVPKELLERRWVVFTKLRGVGLKLMPEKYEFLKMEFVYLGHVVSKDGVWTDKCKIEAMRKWPVPWTVTEARSFLGCTHFYCWFLRDMPQSPTSCMSWFQEKLGASVSLGYLYGIYRYCCYGLEMV